VIQQTAADGAAHDVPVLRMVCLHQPFVSEPGFDDIRHLTGLILEFCEAFFVVIGVGAAGERNEILGLVSPGLQPVGPRRDGAVDQALEPVEFVA
jgi:hypothetical protein